MAAISARRVQSTSQSQQSSAFEPLPYNVFRYPYVTQKGLENLKNYKYVGVDHSLAANYVLQPFWRRAVEFLPRTIAPNMVTLLGFFWILFSFGIQVVYFDPTLSSPSPTWVYLFSAFSVWVYQTLDALDGKQARRTSSSSPLGELFDHGCDAMSLTFLGLTILSTMQIGGGWFCFFLLISFQIAFYAAQWEEYHTGVLELGYLNVTEAQIILMVIHLITAFNGGEWWNDVVLEVGGVPLQRKMFPILFQLGGAYVTLAGNLVKITQHIAKERLDIVKVYSHIVPVVSATALGTLWAYFSPTDIVHNQAVTYSVGLGFLMANLVGKIVLARVCQEPFSGFQPLLIAPLALGLLNALLNQALFPEPLFVVLYLVFTIVAHLHFALTVINLLCPHLKIHCLSISPKQQ